VAAIYTLKNDTFIEKGTHHSKHQSTSILKREGGFEFDFDLDGVAVYGTRARGSPKVTEPEGVSGWMEARYV
jgi:hypothetical protein